MPLPIANIDESTPVGFQPIESGVYHATVTDFDEKETTNPEGKMPVGTGYYSFVFELTDEEVSGKTLKTSVFPTSEKAKPKTKEFLIGMGLSSEDISNLTEFDPGLYVGTECKVQVGRTKPNEEGVVYNNIVRVIPLDDASDELPS
jgi:hypothetical protein